MPGAYSEKLFDTREKRDRFWNLRLGFMISDVPGLLVFEYTKYTSYTLAILLGILAFVASWKLVFVTNFLGTFMERVMGPYHPHEGK